MEVPPVALRDVTNQNSLEEVALTKTVTGCGTPTGLFKEAVVDELLLQITRQCEFYFSDANILKDQFLLKKVKTSKDGWVKLEVIEGFRKMQKLTKSHEIVIKALALSEKLEISDDGLSVRRRAPLPEWDPTVYYRTLIISELPDADVIKWSSLTEFFTTQGMPPTLVRFFASGRKIPSDLKRSQALHPHLGTKPSAVVEFSSREEASRACSIVKQKCPTAYVHFLSDGAKKTSDCNSKTKDKKEKRAPKKLEKSSSGRPAFLLNLKPPSQTTQVIHLREPIGPPSENSPGFPTGWRELIRFERMCFAVATATTTAASAPSVYYAPPPVSITPHSASPDLHPIVPNDNAIVSILPTFPVLPSTE